MKLIIYKDYDIIEELKKIWRLDSAKGTRKDKMLLELIENIEKSVELIIENGNKTRKD